MIVHFRHCRDGRSRKIINAFDANTAHHGLRQVIRDPLDCCAAAGHVAALQRGTKMVGRSDIRRDFSLDPDRPSWADPAFPSFSLLCMPQAPLAAFFLPTARGALALSAFVEGDAHG